MPRRGHQSQSKTFETRAEALAGAVQVEAAMRSPTYEDPSVLKGITLAAALRRCAEKVTVHKKSNQQERNRIERLCRHPMGQRYIRDLRACDFAAFRDERLQQVGANAVRLELAPLSHLYTIAIEEWSWPLQRQLRNVRKPSPPRGRERRLYEDEQQRLLGAIARPTRRQCAPWLEACVRLALETGMRAGEILSLRWTHVHLQRHVAYLPDTKNGERRIVPLSRAAVQVLRSLPRQADEPRVIQGFYDTSALDAAFALASRDAGIEDFKFHDLRHEAASRMAPHMKPQEPAKVFGWKTLQMAMRYYNPREDELVAMVRRVEQARLLEQPMLADELLPLAA